MVVPCCLFWSVVLQHVLSGWHLNLQAIPAFLQGHFFEPQRCIHLQVMTDGCCTLVETDCVRTGTRVLELCFRIAMITVDGVTSVVTIFVCAGMVELDGEKLVEAVCV